MSVEPLSAIHPTRRPDIHFVLLSGSIAVALLAAFGLACSYYAKGSNDLEWLYVALILGLPLVQVPIVMLMLRKNPDFWAKGVLVLLPSLTLEVVLWFGFTFREVVKVILALAAVSGLVAALGLGGIVFWVTGSIMGVADGKGAKFRTLLREQPFLVVCFFLTIFTFVTLFLSLSLALHDQDRRLNHKTVALYAEHAGPVGPAAFAGGADPDAEESQPRPFRILFARGSAAVESLASVEGDGDASPQEDPPEIPDDANERRRFLNARHLNRMANEIVEQSEKDHVRVVLAGHTDGYPVDAKSGSYRSNFELSQARANQVMVHLLERLERHPQREWRRNIEWLILPCGDELGFLDGVEERKPGERLLVEVVVLPSDGDRFSGSRQPGGRDLDLLDYIYFGVYTITTTGYGDIIPISAYSKFITTVANFFEIFLMVVFFNVLLSFLREGSHPAKAGEAAAGG